MFSTWTIADDQIDKIEPLITRFKTYCEGKRNITVIRYNFNTRNQRSGQGFESYYTEPRNAVKDCEFGSLKGNLLRGRLACGIIDEIVREKLLQVEDLTHEKCVNMCRLLESSANQLRTLGSRQPEHDVHRLRKMKLSSKTGQRPTSSKQPLVEKQTGQKLTSNRPCEFLLILTY